MSESKYQKVLDNIEKFENVVKFAKEHGNLAKARKYRGTLEELYKEKEELEQEHPLDTHKELEKLVEKLTEENEALKEKIDEMEEEMKAQSERIDRALNPEKYEEKTKAEKNKTKDKQCPHCGRWFKGIQGLKVHLNYCKTNRG
jgi:predicted RNase H-like nuclease (RuvC/YqgF family)